MERDIIDNYHDLTIGDYQEIISIVGNDSLEEIDKQVKAMSILTGKDEDYLLHLPIYDYKCLAAKMVFLETAPEKVSRPADSYRIGKFELIPVTDIRKIITAQYIDFQTFHKAGFNEHFVEILSCLLIPKGKNYNQDYDILEVQDAIRSSLNVFDAVSLYAFFIVSCSESIKAMLTSLLQEVEKIQDKRERMEKKMQIKALLKDLETSGVGSQT